MAARHVLLAALVGVAGFMFTAVAVTALLADAVEFSVLVGLPVAALVGIVLAAFVYTRQTARREGAAGTRLASALVAAAAAYLVTMALAVTVGGGVTASMLTAVGVSVGVAAVVYWKNPAVA